MNNDEYTKSVGEPTELQSMKKELDKVRRMYCLSLYFGDGEPPEEIAASFGWDCYDNIEED